MAAVFVLIGFVLFILGVAALFKPLPKIWLKTRGAAAIAIVLSVVSCGVGGALMPAASLEETTPPSEVARETASTEQAREPQPAAPQPRRNGITMAEYSAIQTGMTYDQVHAIIGEHGEEMSRSDIANITTVAYTWQNRGGSNAMLMFQNGELVQKSQFGLK